MLLALLSITLFAVLSAAAGIHAFRAVGERLDVIDRRVPPTVAALELSRSAERIIAAAPALLAVNDRARRDELKAALAYEVAQLNERLLALRSDGPQALPLAPIDTLVGSLTARLQELDGLVARRLETSDRVAALRRRVFDTNAEIQRLLGPWLDVLDSQVVRASQDVQPAAWPEAEPAGHNLPSLIALQRLTQSAQRQVGAAVDLLAEVSTAEQLRRIDVLEFQLGLALRELVQTAAGLDPRLRPLFLEQVGHLRRISDGPSALAEARRQEIALQRAGSETLAAISDLSNQLSAQVDRLGRVARSEVGDAVRDALSVQQASTRTMATLVSLSLLTSALIAWLYVGRNILRRLSSLSDRMLAIASGSTHAPVVVEGTDEIAAMGHAIEVLRRNTVERDALLAERAQAADRLELQVRQRTAELEAANRDKSRFLAVASHDLRQPLHALNLFIAKLRSEANAEERERLVERVDAAVASMNELFDALLDMSKLEAGVLQPEFSEFPVARVLERIETTFADAARSKGIRLSVSAGRAWVRSDFVLLERILLNLVSNAVRYTSAGGVLIGVRRRGRMIRIDVCDTGPGIPTEQQPRIFAEFYRLAAPEHRGGLGLGLAIVDRLGRLLDHPIDVQSQPGRGSRFSVSVPCAARRADAADPMPAAALAGPIVQPFAGKRVLMIDDDALVVDAMSGMLRGWGCDVLPADTEMSAFERAADPERRPDLIVADYRLRDGRTGIDAIERLRTGLGAPIPAVLISGDTSDACLHEARARDLPLLHKPVSPMRLRAVLDRLLRTAAQREPAR